MCVTGGLKGAPIYTVSIAREHFFESPITGIEALPFPRRIVQVALAASDEMLRCWRRF